MSVPTIHFDISKTLVVNRDSQEQIHCYDHPVFVPIGTEIELVDPNVSVFVVGIRVLGGRQDIRDPSLSIPGVLCLDVTPSPPNRAALTAQERDRLVNSVARAREAYVQRDQGYQSAMHSLVCASDAIDKWIASRGGSGGQLTSLARDVLAAHAELEQVEQAVRQKFDVAAGATLATK